MQSEEKLAGLKSILNEIGTVLVTYSGGTDSAFLASVAHEVLGDRMLAVQVTGEVFNAEEISQAGETAVRAGFPHHKVELDFLKVPGFAENTPDRCYHCRRTMFSLLQRTSGEYGPAAIIDGSNTDDTSDYRPGHRAALEAGVRSPLAEAGLTKQEIRELSRAMGLPTWDKPSSPCLASRIPYGTPVTLEILQRIDRSETFLRRLGAGQVRLRHHGDTARIEVMPEDMPRLLDDKTRSSLVAYLKSLGYRYVTLDLSGYRTGSLNDAMNDKIITKGPI
jgi:pyridinium-3,5-biscarboxylic acid mononucleotide sulfurtransferase